MKINFMMLKNFLRGNPLKLVSLGGLALALVLALVLAFLSLTRDMDIFPRRTENPFSRELRNYDAALATERPDLLDLRLDQLQRQARGQEEWLSVLKRRRNLASSNSRFLAQYQRSAEEALRAFPSSETMIAVVGDSLIHDSMNEQRIALLRSYARRLSQLRFSPIALSLYSLTGDLASPARALAIPGIEQLLATELPQELMELVMINEILLGIHRGEIPETNVRINRLLNDYPESRELLALGAEFFFDHGDPLRSSELFSRLGDSHISRTADALALAGEIPGARNIWIALGSDADSPGLQARSLYNLAATSTNEIEAASWIGRIFSVGGELVGIPGSFDASIETFGTILFSRYQETSRSIAILLGDSETPFSQNPYIDLEILRRRMETMPLNRITAEVWLLLGRHPEAEALYQWGSWYFDRQRLFAETAQLIRIASIRQMDAPWINLCRSLSLIREGRIDDGIRILEELSSNNPGSDWRVTANIARVLESRNLIPTALTNYEIAAGMIQNPRDLSLIQVRISRCLETLGRDEESRRALEYALELDPDNFEAASLLRRSPQRLFF